MNNNTRKICFPVVHHISVQKFQLYPGETDGDGLIYEVKPGVNIVVGINGLGKTTFLNLLFRILAGLEEIRVGEGLGMGRRTTTPCNHKFFSSRVEDGAGEAYANATIGFGNARIKTTRRLSDLRLTNLSIDGRLVINLPPEELEKEFQKEILRLSGLTQFVDYMLLLQFIFFFLEDRQALIWDENAQSEILRVLYYDPTRQTEYTRLYNSVVSLDSDIRNTLSVVNRQKKRLHNELAKCANTQTQSDLNSLKTTLNETLKSIEHFESEEEKFDDERIKLRESLEIGKINIEQKRGILRHKKEECLASIFSRAETTALYAVASAIGSRGCIMCGSKSEELQLSMQEKIKNKICPLCNSLPAEREYETTDQTCIHSTGEIDSLETENKKLEHSIKVLEKELTEAQNKYIATITTLNNLRRQAHEIQIQISAIEQSLPATGDGIEKTKEKLVGFQEALDELRQEKEEAESDLRSLVENGEKIVATIAHHVVEKFSIYIQGFMAEQCSLQYTVKEKSLGQGSSSTKFRFPLFSVQITSGVFKDNATNRYDAADVSESQREFIDLAFRMSLIAEITSECPAMLVVETPEASLDSVFVPRAGNMINQFLAKGSTQNYMIASTNLNREAMIPALFGVISEYDAHILKEKKDQITFNERSASAIPATERESRIVNLLNIAAKNAALGNYKEEYNDAYCNAVFPQWESFDNLASRY